MKTELKKQAEKAKINLDVLPLEQLEKYLRKEGYPKAGSVPKVFKEVLKKLRLAPDYYERLEQMELKAAAFWRCRPPKPIFAVDKKVEIE